MRAASGPQLARIGGMRGARETARPVPQGRSPLPHPSLRALVAACAVLALLLGAGSARADAPGADADSCLRAHEEAQLQRLHGHYLEARELLLQCAQAACPGLVRGDCKTWLGEVEASLPTLVLAVVDDAGRDLIEVRVSSGGTLLSERVDGRALVLNPGIYTLRFEAQRYAPQELQLSIREAEKQRIVRVVLHAADAGAANAATASEVTSSSSARDEPAQRQRGLRLASYVLSGAAVASLATGIAFGAVGKKKLDELQACKPNCREGEVNTGKRRYVIANSMFAVAGALAVAAAVTLGFGLRKRDTEQRPVASVDVQRHGVSFHWSMGF